MSGFVGRVGEAVQRRAARRTAASGPGLAVLALGVLIVAAVVVIGRELVAAGRSAWWVLRTVPTLARLLALAAGAFWVVRDPWFAVPLTVALVGLLLWPRLSKRSFQARIAGPARAVAIRRAWTSLADACGLGIRQRPGWDGRPRTRTATLRRATSTTDGVGTRLEVRVLPGQTPADLTSAAEKLAAATDSVDWAVTPTGLATVTVDLVAVDVLAPVLPAQLPSEPYAALVPATVTVGRCLSGEPWRLTTAAHTLTAGCTGSGKGSVMWSTLTALAPAIRAGSLRVAGVDLKGGMELGTGRALFARLATTPEDAVELHSLGRSLAQESEEASVIAHVTTQQAYALLDVGRADQAVEHVRAARAAAGSKVPSLVRAWLAAAEAEMRAAIGDSGSTVRLLDQAAEHLESADADLPFIFLDEAHLARWRGHCLARLGHEAAVTVLTEALKVLDPQFRRAAASLHTDLATAHAAMGDQESSAHHAGIAIRFSQRTGSHRQRARLKPLLEAKGE